MTARLVPTARPFAHLCSCSRRASSGKALAVVRAPLPRPHLASTCPRPCVAPAPSPNALTLGLCRASYHPVVSPPLAPSPASPPPPPHCVDHLTTTTTTRRHVRCAGVVVVSCPHPGSRLASPALCPCVAGVLLTPRMVRASCCCLARRSLVRVPSPHPIPSPARPL